MKTIKRLLYFYNMQSDESKVFLFISFQVIFAILLITLTTLYYDYI